jgi:hypothetical protein
VSKRCRHPGCQLAGVKFCRCFGRKGNASSELCCLGHPRHIRPARGRVGHEIWPGCLKVVAYVESKLLADTLAQRLGDD